MAKNKHAGKTVAEILKDKQGRIKSAPLGEGSPSWDELMDLTWEETERRARAKLRGYRAIKKLLGNEEYDK
jgi:hypothetical protein